MTVQSFVRSLPWFRSLAALSVALFAIGSLAWAQETQNQDETPATGDPAVQTPQLNGDYRNFAKPLDQDTDYASWQAHVVQRPEQAIVLVRYSPTPGTNDPLNTATGLIIRCDGFILVPKAMREAAIHHRHAEVVIPASPTPLPALPHPGINSTVSYALVKVNGFHIPCLPMLAPDNITAGMPVRILWAAPNETNGFTVKSRNATVTTPGGRDGIMTLNSDQGGVANIPDGAVIIDTKSGAAIGVASHSDGSAVTFSTFERARAVFDDVGIAPIRDAVNLPDGQGKKPDSPSEMVWVPGGPIRLRDDSRFAKLYGTDVICMPGFYVDTYPVTNKQYRTWLPTHKVRNLPEGWSYSEEQSPIRRDDLAATGMLREDAGRYATDRSCRLLTEAEWIRASCVDSSALEWVQGRDTKWNATAHKIFDYLKGRIVRANSVREQSIKAAEDRGLRIDSSKVKFDIPVDPGEFDTLAQMVNDAMHQEIWMWGWVHPVGIYQQDISVFGLHDVLTNPTEYLQYAERTSPTSEKLSPSMVDQYWNDFQWIAANTPSSQPIRDFYQKVFEILLWHDQWDKEVMGETGRLHSFARRIPTINQQKVETTSFGSYIFAVGDQQITGKYMAGLASRCEYAFRCAW